MLDLLSPTFNRVAVSQHKLLIDTFHKPFTRNSTSETSEMRDELLLLIFVHGFKGGGEYNVMVY